MSNLSTSDLTASGQERPALELIDRAVVAAKEAAREAEGVIADVKWGLRLIAGVIEKAEAGR
jgi:hypothetical protein